MDKEQRKVRFGVEVKVARTRKDWRQVDLARRAELSKTYVSEIENGRRDPSLTTILKLSEALDVPPEQLINGGGS